MIYKSPHNGYFYVWSKLNFMHNCSPLIAKTVSESKIFVYEYYLYSLRNF